MIRVNRPSHSAESSGSANSCLRDLVISRRTEYLSNLRGRHDNSRWPELSELPSDSAHAVPKPRPHPQLPRSRLSGRLVLLIADDNNLRVLSQKKAWPVSKRPWRVTASSAGAWKRSMGCHR